MVPHSTDSLPTICYHLLTYFAKSDQQQSNRAGSVRAVPLFKVDCWGPGRSGWLPAISATTTGGWAIRKLSSAAERFNPRKTHIPAAFPGNVQVTTPFCRDSRDRAFPESKTTPVDARGASYQLPRAIRGFTWSEWV